MEKLYFSNDARQQRIDVRSQHDYQKGSLKNSLNFNPGNFKKYASYYLNPEKPIVFIIGEEDEELLKELSESAEEMGYSKVDGYLLAEELPSSELKQLPTISPEDFIGLDEDYVLLDVRHPDEITRPAPKKNLVNIPFEELRDASHTFDKETPIYTLCGSGNRSTAAASYLVSEGFRPAVIEGGMKALQEYTK